MKLPSFPEWYQIAPPMTVIPTKPSSKAYTNNNFTLLWFHVRIIYTNVFEPLFSLTETYNHVISLDFTFKDILVFKKLQLKGY